DTFEAMLLARTLMVATELGVFEALVAQPLAASELAARIASDPRATAKLLDACVGVRYLRYRDGRYALAPGARRWLLAGSGRSLRDNVRFRFFEWDLVAHLADFVRSGRALDVHEMIGTESWALYQRGMRSLAGLSAGEVAQRTPVPPGARA